MSAMSNELLTIEETGVNRYKLDLTGSFLDIKQQLNDEFEQMQEDDPGQFNAPVDKEQ